MKLPPASRRIAPQSALPSRQRGVALVVALLMLVLTLIITMAVVRPQALQSRMATNQQARNIALQSAEAALREAENGILTGQYSNFAKNNGGLYLLDPASTSQAKYLDNSIWTTAGATLSYGGPSLTGNGPRAGATTQYIIEQLPSVANPGQALNGSQYGGAAAKTKVYRITAYSTGPDGTAAVRLQSIFH